MMLRRSILAILLAATAVPATAQAVDPAHLAAMKTLMASKDFATARASLDGDYDRIVKDLITLTEIPAPPFKEDVRAKAYLEMLRAEGLTDVEIDGEGNAMGLRKGTGNGPLLVVTAHLDTVFPAGTNVKVRREGDKLLAPGIGDDTSSLPVLLAFIRAMKAANITTTSDILFMGNVGEEGEGDLRGVKYLFTKGKYKDRIKQFISFEPGQARVTDAGVGSKRYKITFKGPGGHSLGAFGLVSPAYAMAAAMVEFGKMQVPAKPRTVFNVGIVEGGTSVNSIPFEMAMTVDMRSEGVAELKAEEDYLLALVPKAVAGENATRSTAKGPITADIKLIGDRPVGATPRNADIVQTAAAAVAAGDGTPSFGAGSTDSNFPMSLGIPAVTLGSGFQTERSHSLDEALLLDRPAAVKHMAMGLATILSLAGATMK
jgi:acetylornithine deacetylase/succinyl-diaminopimelate desuccinylase-like protein